jgi:hypothetical protein
MCPASGAYRATHHRCQPLSNNILIIAKFIYILPYLQAAKDPGPSFAHLCPRITMHRYGLLHGQAP